MNRKEFIRLVNTPKSAENGNLVSLEEYNEIIEHSILVCGKEVKHVVAMEELAELTKEISKLFRGEGDRYALLEEIADVLICIDFLRNIYDIDGDMLRKALAIKACRERDRRKEN